MLGQGLGVPSPAQTALGAVEDQQWCTGTALQESDLRTAYVHECFMHTCRHGLFLLVVLRTANCPSSLAGCMCCTMAFSERDRSAPALCRSPAGRARPPGPSVRDSAWYPCG